MFDYDYDRGFGGTVLISMAQELYKTILFSFIVL